MKLFYPLIFLLFSCSTEPEVVKDCAGVENGSATIDDCEQCVGGTTGNVANYLQDCVGECGGDALEDCLGVCNGLALTDECGTCDTDATNDCTQDCLGVWGGTAVEDKCGECSGDNSTCLTVSDIDGNVYSTVIIGNQIWMAENLKTTRYSDGSAIPTNYGDFEWEYASSGVFEIYDKESSIGEIHGFLYNWFSVDDERELCPIGWHVPSDDEFTTLVDYLGGEDIAGGKMKESGHVNWEYYSESATEGATNESGFTALPSGFRSESSGNFHSLGSDAYFWSSTEMGDGGIPARARQLHKEGTIIERVGRDKRAGFSVRCIEN